MERRNNDCQCNRELYKLYFVLLLWFFEASLCVYFASLLRGSKLGEGFFMLNKSFLPIDLLRFSGRDMNDFMPIFANSCIFKAKPREFKRD